MRTLWTLALNDLTVASRDKVGLFWMLLFPLLLALFFGSMYGGTSGGKPNALPIAVLDEDDSAESRALLARLKKQEGLQVVEPTPTLPEARDRVRRGQLTAYLVLPKGLGDPGARWRGGARLVLGVDPARAAEAGYLEGMLAQAYFAGFAESFSDPGKSLADLKRSREQVEKSDEPPATKAALLALFRSLEPVMEQLGKLPKEAGGGEGGGAAFQIPIEREAVARRTGPRPASAFEITFPSSMLWSIIGCVITFATALVSEHVGGTWLRLQVAPLARWQLLAGKGLACFSASLAVALVLLLFGVLLLGVRVESPLYLLLALVCTAFCFTGLMMFLATLGKTPEAVAGFASGILMPLAMIGGGMIPLMVMPAWLLRVSDFSPVKWGIYALEGAVWRGFSLAEMLLPCAILLAVGAVFFGLGVRVLSRRGA